MALRWWVFVLAGVLFILAFPWITPRPRVNSIQAAFRTKIVFHGIVLDQEQRPVAGARVEGSVLNNFKSGTPVEATTGADGRFEIHARGASLPCRCFQARVSTGRKR